nr:zinc finger, CCHC-type, retrotransposon Gag domain protein [Tanacetum cinerariifolium]
MIELSICFDAKQGLVGYPKELIEIIMANLPPPNHAVDLPEDKPVNPELAPIIPHHVPAQPEGYVYDDDMEDGFTLQIKPQPAWNMNWWLVKDDDKEVEEDGVDDNDEEEMEMDEDNGRDDNKDEAEVINAYEEFGHNFYIRESSYAGTLFAGNGEVNPAGPIGCNLKSIHRVVTRLDKQMFYRYKTEKKMVQKFKEDEFGMNDHEYDIMIWIRQIMPPKGMFATAIQRLVADKVVEALEVDRAIRNNPDVAGGLGGNGGQGVVELCRWFEKTESVFRISDCAERSKVKFATATLQGRALTWWNTQVATLGLAVVNKKSWNDMKKMINALQTLLPQIRAEIREEFRTSSGPSDAGGNPPPVTIHTWLERFNKKKPRLFEKATAPVDAENWISHMEKIFDVMGCEDAFKTRLAVYKFEGAFKEMVNTRTDADLSATVQNALQTLLPQIHAEIREEFRTSSGPSDAGGNPPPVTIHTSYL